MLYRLPCVTNTVVCRRSAALPARGYYSSTEQTWGKPAPIILIVIMNSIIIILIIITTNIIIILIRTSIIIVDTMFTNTILFLWRYTAWFDMGTLDGNPIQYFSPRLNISHTSDCLSQIYSQPDIRIMPTVNIFPLSDISRCSGTDLSAPIYWDIWRSLGGWARARQGKAEGEFNVAESPKSQLLASSCYVHLLRPAQCSQCL